LFSGLLLYICIYKDDYDVSKLLKINPRHLDIGTCAENVGTFLNSKLQESGAHDVSLQTRHDGPLSCMLFNLPTGFSACIEGIPIANIIKMGSLKYCRYSVLLSAKHEQPNQSKPKILLLSFSRKTNSLCCFLSLFNFEKTIS